MKLFLRSWTVLCVACLGMAVITSARAASPPSLATGDLVFCNTVEQIRDVADLRLKRAAWSEVNVHIFRRFGSGVCTATRATFIVLDEVGKVEAAQGIVHIYRIDVLMDWRGHAVAPPMRYTYRFELTLPV